ncbi:hypothetical protein H5410_009999 [Solanum commersonii]|uniref:Uncharacterized protein n=1 Tax=Solanum commersonii TaxID=4109 RepID=A0A9J6AJH5_SOLCO|nr:hypothetical protein H5410_009999 [Solanum commersonii]
MPLPLKRSKKVTLLFDFWRTKLCRSYLERRRKCSSSLHFPTVGGKGNSTRFATAILFDIVVVIVMGLAIRYLLFMIDEDDVNVDNPCACA